MKCIHKATGLEAKVGDLVTLNDEPCVIKYLPKPHKSSSSGKVTIGNIDDDRDQMEYYVSVVGLEWIERV